MSAIVPIPEIKNLISIWQESVAGECGIIAWEKYLVLGVVLFCSSVGIPTSFYFLPPPIHLTISAQVQVYLCVRLFI